MNLARPASERQSPPLGDLSTEALVRLLAEAWRTGERPLRCRVRGVSLDEVRIELRRRETLGVGVAR